MTKRIVGIALLRNEEYFVRWSLKNVVEFCDELIVVDTGSTDRTLQKLDTLRDEHSKITLHRISNPNHSHRYIQHLAGEPVWVFGVDGDEIYHPEGLIRLRSRLLAGAYDDYWRLDGYMIHPVQIGLDQRQARGFITPHTPPGNKLYNFGALRSWIEPERERLHGKNLEFREGYTQNLRRELFRGERWEECDLRALHLCFFPRTSMDDMPPARRPNPSELRQKGIRRALSRARDMLSRPLDRDAGYKARRYRRGPVAEVDITGFGRPGDWGDRDDQAETAEGILAAAGTS